MYKVSGTFQNLTQNDIDILRAKGFTIENESNMSSSMRQVSTNTVPAVVNTQSQTVTVLPATWQDYTRDFNSLFSKKFTASITTPATGGGISFGGMYENEVPAFGNYGYIRDNAGGAVLPTDINCEIQEFTQSQFGAFIKAPGTDVPTLAKFARFCAQNPIAVVAMRITSNNANQLLQQPQYFEKVTLSEVKENTISTVAKPAIVVEQFQSTIANIMLPEPFIVDGSSFFTYGVLVGGISTLEIAYAEVGSLSRGTMDTVKEIYKKYNKITCG